MIVATIENQNFFSNDFLLGGGGWCHRLCPEHLPNLENRIHLFYPVTFNLEDHIVRIFCILLKIRQPADFSKNIVSFGLNKVVWCHFDSKYTRLFLRLADLYSLQPIPLDQKWKFFLTSDARLTVAIPNHPSILNLQFKPGLHTDHLSDLEKHQGIARKIREFRRQHPKTKNGQLLSTYILAIKDSPEYLIKKSARRYMQLTPNSPQSPHIFREKSSIFQQELAALPPLEVCSDKAQKADINPLLNKHVQPTLDSPKSPPLFREKSSAVEKEFLELIPLEISSDLMPKVENSDRLAKRNSVVSKRFQNEWINSIFNFLSSPASPR